MKHHRAVCFLAAAVAALPAQETAREQAARGFLFTIPAGFNVLEKEEGTFLVESTAGIVTLIGLSANPVKGDVRHSFDEIWTALKQPYRISEESQPASVRFKQYPAFQAAAIGSDQSKKRWAIA